MDITETLAPPQWSPVVTTGTTLGRSRLFLERLDLAAMEPRRDDGDDAIGGWLISAPFQAAMEPRRDDGDDTRARQGSETLDRPPQWSPVVTTGTTVREFKEHIGVTRPQWSPVVTTGTTGRQVTRRGRDGH